MPEEFGGGMGEEGEAIVGEGEIRALANPVAGCGKPSAGGKTLAGMERIKIGDVKRRLCDSWSHCRTPRRVNIERHPARPDRFLNFDEPEADPIHGQLVIKSRPGYLED